MRVALEATGIPGIDEAIISTIGDSEVRVQTDELDPTEEVPKVRARDRRGGRRPAGPGHLQPDRPLLG